MLTLIRDNMISVREWGTIVEGKFKLPVLFNPTKMGIKFASDLHLKGANWVLNKVLILVL